MPNWCYNRVTVFGNDQTEKIKEVEKIFESKTPFNDIFPMPDWKNTPNENGELPILKQEFNKDGSVDVDNAIPVCDWENWDELSAYHHSHLMHVNQMCILKRDSQQLDYYAGVFGNA